MANIADVMKELKDRREAGTPGARESIWARPVTWRGRGQAVDLQDGRLEVVPFASRAPAFQPGITDLTSEWELVDPSDVLAERERS